ncbi:MAG: hypothetical protein IGQ88_13455 [Gloeomargaritaceae cyanobacterium C42_A2020_066]|nr:hypothetical protein [Gloeomargaritaceae cyanobacterium C42_A2020_066]
MFPSFIESGTHALKTRYRGLKVRYRNYAVALGLALVPYVPLTPHLPMWWLLRWLRKHLDFQLNAKEITLILSAIQRHPQCRLLVFGLGNDSLLWCRANCRGTTYFLEDNSAWFTTVTRAHPQLRADLIQYGTQLHQWPELLTRPKALGLELPGAATSAPWDVILVDAPAGFGDGPGRMQSIYAAATELGRPGTDVFVHDCDRPAEQAYCDQFLKPENLRAEVARLRHYQWP